jgi:hypothetical protein
MIWSVTSSRELEAIEELQSNPSDRAVGIVIASFVEMHLTDLIKSYLIKAGKKLKGETIEQLQEPARNQYGGCFSRCHTPTYEAHKRVS